MASLSYTTTELQPPLMPFCCLNQQQCASIKPTLMTLNVSQQEMRGRAPPLRQLRQSLLLQPCCVFHLSFLPQRLSQLSKLLLQMKKKCSGARHNSHVWRGPRRPAWAGPPGERGNVDLICAAQATAETVSVSQAAQPLPEKPFEHLKVDFTELTPRKGKKYCLVMVDVWSKWSFADALLAEIIPRWGIPAKISGDKGALFVMKLPNKREKVWALIWANMAC